VLNNCGVDNVESREVSFMRLTSVLSSAIVLTLGFTGAHAYAQDTGTPTQPPAAPALDTTAPTAAPNTAPPASADKTGNEDEPADEGRLRIGFDIAGGAGAGADISGPFLGATLRVGWQLNHLMAVYGQVTPYAWFGATDKSVAGQKVEMKAIGGFQFTPLFSLTPINLLEIAAGPSLDRLAGGSAGGSVAGASVSEFSGMYFALHGRIALHVGGKPNTTTGRRTSFTIGGDIHPTFVEGNTLTFYTVGLGADWY
jgi:hypothetical protein